MNPQDQLGTDIARHARERLLTLAEECHARNRHALGRDIADAATRGIEDDYAELIAVAPILVPVRVDWDWMPTDWVIAMFDEHREFLAYWTQVPDEWSP